jgi:DNA topoisomerase-2
LVLTEGDSAFSSCIAGLSSVSNPEYFGVFPLRGKPLNVRDMDISKIKDNVEIKNIINILGLEFGKKYTDLKKLRYGKVVFMADADCDGNHIRGLLINLFDTYWPELLKMDFLYDFVTPIIKATKGKVSKYYYKVGEYEKDKEKLRGYDLKWLKGLGTLEPDEMKEFFKKIDKHLIRFHYDTDETEELIDMLFNGKRADDRKEWLKTYKPIEFSDKLSAKQTYDKFINNELMEFSMYNNIRQIQSSIDGFKPSQRKAFFTLLKKNSQSEIKVSSLSGAVIDQAGYHHGNSSIESAIIGMAQTFVGVNNINLLSPKGQFGSRLKGGEDSASPRYIFTKLSDLTEYIFRKEDNPILDYLDDDGMPIEPKYYVPIIPMVLINGSIGLGTGYSSNVPMYNPLDLIAHIGNKIQGKKTKELLPYYKGFKGEITFDSENNRFITRGILEKPNTNVIRISELPIGMWNNKYFEKLDKLVEDKVIKDYMKNCTDTTIDIKLILTRENMQELYRDGNIYKKLSLETYIPVTNMHLFDVDSKIKKYTDQYEIIDDFMKIRLEYYKKRKEHQLGEFRKEISITQNRMKFLKMVIDGSLVINKRSRDTVEADLVRFGIDKLEDSYGYLLNMSIMSFTKDRLQVLKEEIVKLKEKYKELIETSEEKIWIKELIELKSKIMLENKK